ncbi:hypothetical protein HDV05_001901 [Chytridiales sp. JEL 0842]|nr:hypothetical protein HDV05_001901 [Chytridiales sp. JEL 0842]
MNMYYFPVKNKGELVPHETVDDLFAKLDPKNADDVERAKVIGAIASWQVKPPLLVEHFEEFEGLLPTITLCLAQIVTELLQTLESSFTLVVQKLHEGTRHFLPVPDSAIEQYVFTSAFQQKNPFLISWRM